MPQNSAGTLQISIEGFEMPGLSCAPAGAGEQYTNVHVGIQRLREVIDLQPGDADRVEWSFAVTTKNAGDEVDFGGPFVHGRRGERFLYLSWGVVEGDRFRMFRRAKLYLADADRDVLASALATGSLRCRVRMTDPSGNPRCARVRPPDAVWTSPGS